MSEIYKLGYVFYGIGIGAILDYTYVYYTEPDLPFPKSAGLWEMTFYVSLLIILVGFIIKSVGQRNEHSNQKD